MPAPKLTAEQLQEQAAIAERLAAAGLPVLTAEKLGQYRDAGNAKRFAAIGRMSPAGFMAGLSTAGRLVAPAAPEPAGRPRVVVVDRWNGARFLEVELRWNGAAYVEVA